MNFNIKFNNLFRKSIQPDSICAEVFQQIGVSTQFNKKEAIIQKEGVCPFQFIEVNCIDFPDLAQTLAVTFSILKTNFLLKGLQTLNIKETNRILALKQELLKIGVNLQVTEDKISSQAFESLLIQDESLIFNTYHDHRMAMAFAPLSLIYDNVTIENPQVVGKSYPNFWREFEKIKNTTL